MWNWFHEYFFANAFESIQNIFIFKKCTFCLKYWNIVLIQLLLLHMTPSNISFLLTFTSGRSFLALILSNITSPYGSCDSHPATFHIENTSDCKSSTAVRCSHWWYFNEPNFRVERDTYTSLNAATSKSMNLILWTTSETDQIHYFWIYVWISYRQWKPLNHGERYFLAWYHCAPRLCCVYIPIFRPKIHYISINFIYLFTFKIKLSHRSPEYQWQAKIRYIFILLHVTCF